jgi:hypothetical protein
MRLIVVVGVAVVAAGLFGCGGAGSAGINVDDGFGTDESVPTVDAAPGTVPARDAAAEAATAREVPDAGSPQEMDSGAVQAVLDARAPEADSATQLEDAGHVTPEAASATATCADGCTTDEGVCIPAGLGCSTGDYDTCVTSGIFVPNLCGRLGEKCSACPQPYSCVNAPAPPFDGYDCI